VTGGLRVLPCGERAVLLELDGLDAVLGLHAALEADRPEGVEELVPAARTLLVAFDPARTGAERLSEALRAVRFQPGAPVTGELVEVPVTYDGEDLEEVASLAEMSAEEVVRRHRDGEYVAAFCGFAPGFAYLDGLDEALHVPRRDSPRTRVPAGAVALADRFTAVYPRASPGGWRLIGRTELGLWDVSRDPPAVLVPGTRVRFTDAAGDTVTRRQAGAG
jgi:KipI family sensor histidine kinase inhibitor